MAELKTFKVNDNNDLFLINGNISLVEDIEALEVILTQKLKTFFTEWFLDSTIGIPYFSEVLKKNIDEKIVAIILSQEISEQEEVKSVSIKSIDIDDLTRRFSITFNIESIFTSKEFNFNGDY